MTLEQAKKWIEQLDEAVAAGKISVLNARDEVFAELEAMEAVQHGPDVSAVVEHLYGYTRQ